MARLQRQVFRRRPSSGLSTHRRNTHRCRRDGSIDEGRRLTYRKTTSRCLLCRRSRKSLKRRGKKWSIATFSRSVLSGRKSIVTRKRWKYRFSDPCNISDQLRTTLRGKNLDPDDINCRERFLLHRRQDIFSVDTEVLDAHQSQNLIREDTFQMAPNTAYQLYTIHRYYKRWKYVACLGAVAKQI